MHKLSLFLALVLASAMVSAQPANNDYYGARSNPELAALLSTVEAYHLQQGFDKMRDKRFGPAKSEFDFILRYFPNHPRAILAMTELCQAWKDSKCDLDSYFSKAISVNPNSPGVYLTKGMYEQKNKKLKEAVESYKRALEIDPNSANVHYNLGLAYVELRQYALGNEHAQRAYALGWQLPGLRSKLTAVGEWKTIEPKPTPDKPAAADGAPTKSGESPGS